jgi:hypothetical protein
MRGATGAAQNKNDKAILNRPKPQGVLLIYECLHLGKLPGAAVALPQPKLTEEENNNA